MEEEQKKLKMIPKWVMQTFDRLMAQGLHRSECFDYYFFESFKLVRPYVGDDVLREHFKERWEKVNLKLIELGAMASAIKATFDRLKKDKTINDKEFRDYLFALSQSLFSPLVCEAFVVICENSNLGRHYIENQAFKEQMLKPYSFNIKDKNREDYSGENNE